MLGMPSESTPQSACVVHTLSSPQRQLQRVPPPGSVVLVVELPPRWRLAAHCPCTHTGSKTPDVMQSVLLVQ